jgi:CAAX prenyl protease-like protein
MSPNRAGPWSWLPYVAPLAAFLLLSALEGFLPKDAGGTRPTAYAVFYTVKIALVTIVAWLSRSIWTDLRPHPPAAWTIASIAIGALVIVLWVGLDGRYPALPVQEKRIGFDPGSLPPAWRVPFTAVRLYGLVVVVPLIEELFWRSFLIRWIARQDFRGVPIGAVTWTGALVTSALFAVAHPEWLPALLTGFLWTALLWRSRSVATCWISHAAANALLGIYVLAQGAWRFW